MTEWILRRWNRYGHERVYAATPGGTDLGYLDLKTGRYHSDDQSNLPLLQKAIGDHLGTVPEAVSGGLVSPPPETVDVAEPAVAVWHDIGGVSAGSAAREQGLAARAAQGRVTGFLARALNVMTEERAWRIGADGEQAVALQLQKLGPGWRVLHAVRVGDRGSDIDHVAMGPSGVFTVNAKNHPNASIWVGGDTFLVNGQKQPYVRNSRHEARRAAKLLTEQVGFPVSAVGVVAVYGAQRGFTVKAQPKDGAVVVVARKRISQYLGRLPSRLDSHEVDAIFEVARRSTTWG